MTTLRTEKVTCGSDGAMDLHLWTPDASPRSAILLIQEIFGVGAYIRDVADELADAGYLVGAPDVFWRFAPNWEADHEPGRADRLVREGPATRLPDGCHRLRRGTRASHKQPGITAAPAVMGFCLGGTLAWGVAATAEPSCCVSYYGSGVPSMLGMISQVSCPTLFHFGNSDVVHPVRRHRRDRRGDRRSARLRVEHRDGRARLRQPPERDVLRRERGQFGVEQDHGLPRLTSSGVRALVRRPGPRLADGLLTHLERQPIDVARATRQWLGYVDALRNSGWEILEVPPADDCPDAVFIEDTMVAFGDLMVISFPGAPTRQPETTAVAVALADLGYEPRCIEPPGTSDGGDVLKVGNTVYVGLGGRTNNAGIAQLADSSDRRRCAPSWPCRAPRCCT